MDTKNYNLSFYDCYLRRYKGDYYFYVLGKNGEPLSDVNVNCTFYHRLITNKQALVSLTTDDDGKFKLGPLNDISSVNTNFSGPNGNISETYNINTLSEQVCLPDKLNILEDEEVELPYI